MTRYLIIGAGAIGGGLGGRHAQYGNDVVLVARGEHLEVMAESGLRLRSPDEDLRVPVQVAAGPENVILDVDDVLVVTTKTHQVQAALLPWVDAPVHRDGRVVGTAGERLPVLMALNGVSSESIAMRYFDRVFGVCVWMPAVHLVPGEVIIRAAPRSGIFHIARVPVAAATDEDAELLSRIQTDWRAATFEVPLPRDVMPWKYRKLISNIGNSFQALIGNNGDYEPLVAAARQEARRVLDEAGIEYTGDEEERASRQHSFTVRQVPGEPDEMGGSTWQSMTRGNGSIETDYLNGEIARIARRNASSAPVNAKINSLARIAAAAGHRPGELSADEVRVALGLPQLVPIEH